MKILPHSDWPEYRAEKFTEKSPTLGPEQVQNANTHGMKVRLYHLCVGGRLSRHRVFRARAAGLEPVPPWALKARTAREKNTRETEQPIRKMVSSGDSLVLIHQQSSCLRVCAPSSLVGAEIGAEKELVHL